MPSAFFTHYQNLNEALAHVERVMPRQVGDCCRVQDDGFGCTLFTGHSGDHEAWSRGTKFHQWPNITTIKEH